MTRSTTDAHFNVAPDAQDCALQCLYSNLSCSAGQKPWLVANSATALILCCKPPPHDREQLLHADHSFRTQSLSHGATLHCSEIAFSSGQGAPPNLASSMTVRVLARIPPSHSALQTPHSPQSETRQSVGQGCSLQSSALWVGRQDMPCGPAGTTTCLVTLRVPPPQGSEQGPETHADTSQSSNPAWLPDKPARELRRFLIMVSDAWASCLHCACPAAKEAWKLSSSVLAVW
mmetsp:Transcript_12574/g.28438  ORF Transcript_12574/g.28438 Transcript_12574/m.28438 type:complete len:232 (-) Transcript_12574:1361-2056(-)